MMLTRWDGVRVELELLRAQGLGRFLRALPRAGARLKLDGREFLNFASNDYLGLASHPAVIEAAAGAVRDYGAGTTASRLMCGHFAIHAQLEEALAQWLGTESALVFPSGYQANIAVLTALAGREDAIVSDRLNHASIIDGARLTRAALTVYAHGDAHAAATGLAAHRGARRRVLVSDAVFSMDGHVAPVAGLRAAAEEHDAFLVVDEAHALGVLGDGRGLCAREGITAEVLVGTLGKALGSGGGFVAGSSLIRDLIVNRGRSFIYSTGLSPANAAAAKAALELLLAQPDLPGRLRARSERLRTALRAQGVPVSEGEGAILPVLVGDNAAALTLSEALYTEGILATAIRPPTVPPGTARIRFSVTLGHSDDDLDCAAAVIGRVWRRQAGGNLDRLET
jgi:8-amino-7-oxononanoate synthase